MLPFHFRPACSADAPPDITPESLQFHDLQGLLLWAVRVWGLGWGKGDDVTPWLRRAFDARGAGEAFVALRELLRIVWQSASRPLHLAEPNATQSSPDERRLLAAVRHAADGDLDACRRSLAELLCPLGARTAVLPAWGLARALTGLKTGQCPFQPMAPTDRA